MYFKSSTFLATMKLKFDVKYGAFLCFGANKIEIGPWEGTVSA